MWILSFIEFAVNVDSSLTSRIIHESELRQQDVETVLFSDYPIIYFLIASVTLTVCVLAVVAFCLNSSKTDNFPANDTELLLEELEDDENEDLMNENCENGLNDENTTRRRKRKPKSQTRSNKTSANRKSSKITAPIQLTQHGETVRKKKRFSAGKGGCAETSFVLNESQFGTNPLLYRELKGHSGNLTSCFYSHDNQFIVTSSLDGSVRIWFIQHTLQYDSNSFVNQQILAQLSPKTQSEIVSQMKTNPNVAALRINMKDKSVCHSAVLSERSDRLFCATDGGVIHVYKITQTANQEEKSDSAPNISLNLDLETTWQTPFKSSIQPLSQLIVDPYDQFLIALSHSSDSSVYIYDFKGTLMHTLDTKIANTGAAFSRDGSLLVIVTKQADCKIFALRRITADVSEKLEKFEQITSLKGHSQQVNCVSISCDNTRIVTGSNDGCIRCFELTIDERSKDYVAKEIWKIEASAPIQRLASCPILDNQILYVSSGPQMFLCRLMDGELLGELTGCIKDLTHSISGICFSGDGTMAVYYSIDECQAYVTYTPSIDVAEVDEAELAEYLAATGQLETSGKFLTGSPGDTKIASNQQTQFKTVPTQPITSNNKTKPRKKKA